MNISIVPYHFPASPADSHGPASGGARPPPLSAQPRITQGDPSFGAASLTQAAQQGAPGDPFWNAARTSKPVAPLDAYQAEQQRLAGTLSRVPHADGTVSWVPMSQRVQQALQTARSDLWGAIDALQRPRLDPEVERNLLLIFPYGVTPEVRQGLIGNFQRSLAVLDDAISGRKPVRYAASMPKGSGDSDVPAATAGLESGVITLNADRFTHPSYLPLSDLQFERTLLHESSHAGAQTWDNWYLQNNGYAAWGPVGGKPGRFDPHSYQAPYLANADTNAFAALMLNGRFPLAD